MHDSAAARFASACGDSKPITSLRFVRADSNHAGSTDARCTHAGVTDARSRASSADSAECVDSDGNEGEESIEGDESMGEASSARGMAP